MDLSNLPLLYLKNLFVYLNSWDQIGVLKAINADSSVRSYLFNQRYDLNSLDFYFKMFED